MTENQISKKIVVGIEAIVHARTPSIICATPDFGIGVYLSNQKEGYFANLRRRTEAADTIKPLLARLHRDRVEPSQAYLFIVGHSIHIGPERNIRKDIDDHTLYRAKAENHLSESGFSSKRIFTSYARDLDGAQNITFNLETGDLKIIECDSDGTEQSSSQISDLFTYIRRVCFNSPAVSRRRLS